MPSLVTFNNKIDKEFNKTVKERVNAYFEEKGISRHANGAMIIKTIVILSLYWVPYGLIISGQFSLNWMWFFAFLMGLGMAGIGFSVTHDALHGAYSSNNTVNNFLGTFFDLVGANGYIWKIIISFTTHTRIFMATMKTWKLQSSSGSHRILPINLYTAFNIFWHFRPIVWQLYSGLLLKIIGISLSPHSGLMRIKSTQQKNGLSLL